MEMSVKWAYGESHAFHSTTEIQNIFFFLANLLNVGIGWYVGILILAQNI